MFSRRWRFKLRSSGLWHRVVTSWNNNVSKDQAASIFTLKLEVASFFSVKTEAAWPFEKLSYHATTSCHNSEDHGKRNFLILYKALSILGYKPPSILGQWNPGGYYKLDTWPWGGGGRECKGNLVRKPLENICLEARLEVWKGVASYHSPENLEDQGVGGRTFIWMLGRCFNY
jgi:hypothetical protein